MKYPVRNDRIILLTQIQHRGRTPLWRTYKKAFVILTCTIMQPITIFDLRKSAQTPLKAQIIEGLNRPSVIGDWQFSKTLPSILLYDHKGLKLYDGIVELKQYYLFESELDLFKKYGEEIAETLLPPPKKQFWNGFSQDEWKTPKEKWGDQTVGTNNGGVNGNLGFDSKLGKGGESLLQKDSRDYDGIVIELGAGPLKKTSLLLQAIAGRLKSNEFGASGNVAYYAVRLEL